MGAKWSHSIVSMFGMVVASELRRDALALALALTSCEPRTHPWDGPLDASTVDESVPWLPSRTGGSAGPRATDHTPRLPAGPVGGLWVSCYRGFQPSGDPEKDVTRLGMMCGPANGMSLVTARPIMGTVDAGGAAVGYRFAARRGECYRVFAAATRSVGDLDVTVRSSRGSRLATDHSEDTWPIVDPDRPFCTFDDDEFTVELHARRGTGAFAAEIWRLPAP